MLSTLVRMIDGSCSRYVVGWPSQTCMPVWYAVTRSIGATIRFNRGNALRTGEMLSGGAGAGKVDWPEGEPLRGGGGRTCNVRGPHPVDA